MCVICKQKGERQIKYLWLLRGCHEIKVIYSDGLGMCHIVFRLNLYQDTMNHKTSCSSVRYKNQDHPKTLSCCCSPQRMSGMFTIQKCTKQSNKYLSYTLQGQSLAGHLSGGKSEIMVNLLSLFPLSEWRSKNVRSLSLLTLSTHEQ